jgi:hypothetical protein
MPIWRKADTRIYVAGNELWRSSQNRHLIKKANAGARFFDAIELHVIAVRGKSKPGVLVVHGSQNLSVAAGGHGSYP